MRLYWLNDTDRIVHVYANNLDNRISAIRPHEGDWLDLTIPTGKELYIKQWEIGIVLVSFIDPSHDN